MDFQVEGGMDTAANAGMSAEMEPSFVGGGSGRSRLVARAAAAAAPGTGRTGQYVDIDAAEGSSGSR